MSGMPGVRWMAAVVVVTIVLGATSTGHAAQGGKIIFAARQDIDTLDPHLARPVSIRKVLNQFLDTLIVLGDDGKLYPALAESWSVSPDAKVYTFKLRKNVKFHDGTPFNAESVKFNFDRIQEPQSAGVARSFSGPYDSAEVVDPYTVRIKFKESYAPFLRLVALEPFGQVSPAAVKSMGQDFGRRPVGTGPFIVKEWVPKSHVTMVRNPDYNWASPAAKHQGPAHVDEVVWRIVPEAATRTAILQTGEINIAEDVSYADVAALERNAAVRVLRMVPAGTPWTIFPNVQRFPTTEFAVRRAFYIALNRETINKVVFHGLSKPATSFFHPSMLGYAPTIKESFPYDPAQARKILDEAGWRPGADGIRMKDGKRLELLWLFGTSNGYEEMAPLVQAMVREVGIDLQLREAPYAQVLAANQRNEHNIGESNWWYPDPSVLTTLFHSSQLKLFSRSRLNDPEVDKLLVQASATLEDGKRAELYKRIQKMLTDSAAGYPLVDQLTMVGVRKEVSGFRFSVVGFPLLYDVSVEK
jgi:peptide/nickel transport system substrate-binding protein